MANTLSNWIPSTASATTTASGYGLGQAVQSYPQPVYITPPEPTPKEITVKILHEGTQDGIFLQGKDGKRHWVSVEKIAISVGLEW